MCDVFKDEFRLSNFGLAHNKRDDFITCRWNWHPLVFFIYRIAVATYVTVFFVTTFILLAQNGDFSFMAYLTLWTYLILTLYFLFSAIDVVYSKCKGDTGNQQTGCRSSKIGLQTKEGYNNIAFVESNSKLNVTAVKNGYPGETMPEYGEALPGDIHIASDEISGFTKVCWLLGNITHVFAIVVTAVYFTALFPLIGYTNCTDINLHGVNTFLVIVDTCLSARPVRLLHVIHPVLYGACYLVFSAVYWSFDHVNHVLYPGVLDWNYPGTTAIWVVCLTLVGIPLLQLAHFGAHRLKIHFSSQT